MPIGTSNDAIVAVTADDLYLPLAKTNTHLRSMPIGTAADAYIEAGDDRHGT